MSQASLVPVSELARTPIHYDRFRPEDYGQPGHPHTVYMTAGMKQNCETCFEALFQTAPQDFGDAQFILTAGAYVQKPGYQGNGRAFDLDALVWKSKHWIANTFLQDPQLYLAIEAIIRQNFGTVLTYSYNRPNEDHVHFDDGTSIGFDRMSKSRVIFLQNAIYFVYGVDLGRDGVWGPETDGATRMIRQQLGLGAFSNRSNWIQFLRITADRAFNVVVNRDRYS